MSWGMVGAAAVSVVGGALMDDGGGGGSTTTVESQQTHANPFTSGGGLFGVNFGPGVAPGAISMTQGLSPDQMLELQQLRDYQAALSAQRSQQAAAQFNIPKDISLNQAYVNAGRKNNIGNRNIDTQQVRANWMQNQAKRKAMLAQQAQAAQQAGDLSGNALMGGFGGGGRPGPNGAYPMGSIDNGGTVGTGGGYTGGGGGGGSFADMLANASPEVQQAYQRSLAVGSGSGLDMGITDSRLQDVNDRSLEGAGLFMDASLTSQNAARAGELGMDFLNQLGETDPYAIAQNQYDLLNPILQEAQNQEHMALEQRLFQQGRLGSTGGGQDMNAMFDAQHDSERQLLFDSLGQGLAVQAQNASLGASLSQLDPSIRQQWLGLSQGALQTPLAIQAAMLNQAQVAGGLSGANTVGSLTNPGSGLSAQNAIGAGLMNSGIQGLSQGVAGLFQNNTGANYSLPSNYQGGYAGNTGYGPGSVFSGNNGAL